MPFALVAGFLLLACSASQCVPGDQESGSGVLFATPFFVACTLGILRLLLALWRGARPELGMRWLPGLCGVWVSFVLGLGAMVYLGVKADSYALEEAFSLAGMAFALVGSLVLGLTLIVWRVWLAVRPASAFTWAWLPPTLLLVLPALPMATGATQDAMDFMLVPWALGGFFGAPVSGLMLIALLIEAGVRRSRARRAASAVTAPPPPPPPPPQAS
ncbi:MAG TPA: hypothetical protein PK668_07335 [Myxococcota bacterium]|nr:hypothetical protein [Myxococcota bacterium]HRY92342.1 hypothetical protein [Myxococcota bacterium]HSA23016.1 hypothetical protein [Myxococcota bacterium]